jgi:hypothetical protein
MSDQPSGMKSGPGSDGSLADRSGTPGFPTGEAQPVQSENSFNTQGQNRAEGGGAASSGPSK